MPFDYKIDKERRLVMVSAVGMVTLADALAYQDRLAKDPGFDPSFSQLLDMTQITKLEVEPEGVRTLAQRSAFSPHSRRAFLATSDLIFGYSRMFEMLSDSAGETGIRVFRERDEALAWVLAKSTIA